jgi:hypothetical protein
LANGGALVMVVITGGLVLFVKSGSGNGLPIIAKFVTAPLNVEITFNVRSVIAPEAKVSIFVQTT